MSTQLTINELQANKFYADTLQGVDTFEEMRGGWFWPNGTGTPCYNNGIAFNSMITGNPPSEWSVARTGAGKFVVTFTHSLSNLKNVVATLALNAVTGVTIRVGPVSLANQTVELDVVNCSTGAASDLVGNQNTQIHFRLEMGTDNNFAAQPL